MSTAAKHTRLIKVLDKSKRRIIGLMSGMSMDGVDLALVEISGTYPELKISLEETFAKPYSREMIEALSAGKAGTVAEMAALNVRVAEEFASCVNDFLKAKNLTAKDIDAIGSHGQTIFHDVGENTKFPATIQLGSGSIIAELTGILTISNFRERDIVCGGKGAPLVPLVDWLLYRRSGEIRALNNLGSISNLTIVTPELERVLAFDTGPANMPIDFFAARVPGNKEQIDVNGSLSAQGKVIPEMLKELLANPFFDKPPPKAAGYGEFGPVVLKKIAEAYANHTPHDLLRTGVEFTAQTIADAYTKFVLPTYPKLKSITFTGGGAKNPTLINRVAELLSGVKIDSLDETDRRFSDYKEALAFAVLANELLSGRAGNVPSATGAKQETTLGDISL